MSARTTKPLRCSHCPALVHAIPVDYELGDPVTCSTRCSAELSIGDAIFAMPAALRAIDVAMEEERPITEEERRVVRELAQKIDAEAGVWNEAVGENGGGS